MLLQIGNHLHVSPYFVSLSKELYLNKWFALSTLLVLLSRGFQISLTMDMVCCSYLNIKKT